MDGLAIYMVSTSVTMFFIVLYISHTRKRLEKDIIQAYEYIHQFTALQVEAAKQITYNKEHISNLYDATQSLSNVITKQMRAIDPV